MSSGKRILLITPGFPADESDTTCIPALWTWVKAYASRYPQDKLRVVALHYPFRKGEYRFHGVDITSLGGNNPAGFARAWFILDAIHQIRGIIEREKPDIIHAFWMNATAFIAWHASRGRVPVLVNLMGQDVKASPWYSLLKRKPITFIAPSQYSLSALLQVIPEARARVIHFGMECTPRQGGQKEIDVLGVGSLVPVKRFRDFIRVVGILKERGRVLRTVVIGDGPERGLLQKMIESSDLGEQIQLIGKQTLSEVYGYMSRSRILLHPSENEGFGMVFAEALCHRMTIVSRPVGTATAAPWWSVCQTPEEMAESVAAFLDHLVAVPDQALFSMEKSCSAYRDAYDECGGR